MDSDGTFRIGTFLQTAHHKVKFQRKLRYSAANLITSVQLLDYVQRTWVKRDLYRNFKDTFDAYPDSTNNEKEKDY